VLAGLAGVTAIAAGSDFIVALKDDGSVAAWGGNGYGQTTVPAGLTGVTAVAAGEYHALALKTDGSLVTWGKIYEWPNLVAATVPPDLSGVTAIAAGGAHSVALTVPTAPTITMQPVSQAVPLWQRASFTVTATGYPLSYQWRRDGMNIAGATSDTYSPFATPITQAGSYTVVVGNILGSVTSAPPARLTVNPASPGAVVAWGWNASGQTTVPAAAQSGVTAISARGFHTVALKADGSVMDWGKIYNSTNYVSLPVPAGLSEVKAIAAGENHTVALTTGGSVMAWGLNSSGQTSVPVAAEGGVKAIAAGASYTVALKTDGSVVSWGDNAWGYRVPVPAGLTGVTAIAAGDYHTVALKRDGSVVAWGDGIDQTTVPVAAQSEVTAIAAGGEHSVALKRDGSVVAWGANDEGQTTVPVAAQSGVVAIAAGEYHTVALKSDGSVVTWGYNLWGETTGTPTTADPYTATASPVTLGGQVLSGVTAIAGAFGHTVALIGTAVSLQARHSGNELILSWLTNAAGFTFQSTTSLVPPVTWIDSTNPPAVIGAQFTVTNAATGPARFYRLRKP
jgi:alpha-tubulin suppressor-like RCC1 family protein